MHYLRSFLPSVLIFVLCGFHSDAGIIDSRQSSSATTSSIYNTRFANVTWDEATWTVQTTNLDQGHYQSRQSIANGYLGINVAAVGPFFEQDVAVDGDNINGWPLFSQRQTFATIAGFFDEQPTTNGTNFEWLNQYGGESVISGVPHWGGIVVDLGAGVYLDATVDNSTISNFSSTLNAKEGISTWAYTWSPENASSTFDVSYTMFAHKLYVNQAFVKLQIKPSADTNCTIVNVLDGTSAVRTDFVDSGMEEASIYTAVSPNNLPNVTAYLYSAMEASNEVDASTLGVVSDKLYIGANGSSIAQGAVAALKAGQTTTVRKYVGGATADGFLDPQRTAKGACKQAMTNGFDASMETHIAEWAEVFPPDSVDNYTYPENGTLPADQYIIESAITAVLNEYYLLQNTISANALSNASYAPIDTWSISVGGLTSDSYGGLVFWDAEIWMQPGLAASHPQAAKQIANYRVERYEQAKSNVQTAYQSSKNTTMFSSDAAVFSWTSGRFGNCTGTGPCFDYEYHINGDIAQEFANYWVTSGDTAFFNASLFPIYNSIATFFSEVVTKNDSQYALTNMTDPDEYANGVDNGGFTMPLIADTLSNANMFRQLFGLPVNTTFDEIASNIFISRDSNAGIIDEYTGMNGSISVKQADVVLDTFPLNYQKNYTAQDSLNDLQYYAGKQSLNGPGMTYAIFSIVASAVDTSGCSSYTYQQYSEQPYARTPWFQFSEQLVDDFTANGGTHPAYPFLTGHGGANQVTIFGYLGLRLTPDFTLHIDPSLPPQIPNIKYRTIYFHGWPISATANQTHTTLTRLSNPYITANSTFANTSIPVQIGNNSTTTYQLPPNGTLTFTNRQIANITTVSGNIAQCVPASSPQDFQPGQFPISAVDGAASTKWQPNIANTSQSLTITLTSVSYQPVSSFYFDWAQNPPNNFTVIFHNSSSYEDSSAVTATTQTNVEISVPYNETEINLITPYMSNTTNVTLQSPVYNGNYATLLIQGNQASNATNSTGATVAEWAIIAADT
ncbi:alpha,alpha-trehalase ath1 [Lecanora helva]